jgi:hypothetical protein
MTRVNVHLGSSGPTVLVLADKLDDTTAPRPAGFTADLELPRRLGDPLPPGEPEPVLPPLLWEGDQG